MAWRQVPSIYVGGHAKAKWIDRSLADAYVAYARAGDPLADAVVADLGDLPQKEAARLIGRAVELDASVLSGGPESLRELLRAVTVVPAWYDRDLAQRGCRAFLGNSDRLLMAYVAGAIVEGFSTRISKAFAVTGRVAADGVRRLKQNVRHLLAIFLPRGIEPRNDGWKLTLRIRIVHAQVRWLLRHSHEWNHEAWGVPISAAHLALAAAAFSARLVDFATMLGAKLNDHDRAGVMHIWSYTAYVMGVPSDLLFHNHAEGLQLFKVGVACEPAPDDDAVAMAHRIVESAPAVAGVQPGDRAAAVRHIYRVSRELIGHSAADSLRFPPKQALPILPWLRTKASLQRCLHTACPPLRKVAATGSFLQVLTLADVGEYRITYDLPDHVHSDRSSKW